GIVVAPTNTTMKGADVTFILGVWYTPGDFDWADQVAACAIKDYNIDPRRIYATGCSAGGLASGVMAFQRSNYLAASAPNSGGIAVPGQDMLQDAKRMTPTMTMHGAPGQDVVIVDFAETSQTLYTSGKAKGGFMVNCNHGQGHCRAPEALQVAAWQFMKDHPYGVSPEPYANGLPASFPQYCQIMK
ncbi:MAG TPA: prolyl oligopeptidase family serine peptidase, partial [Polyangiales bacterium]